LLVFSFVALAVGGLVLVQRLVPIERRQEHNDVAGFIYAVLGVAYAVLLGLMVAALALIIGLVLFTVAALDYPFRGDVRIGPEAFEQVLGRFESSKLSDLRR
jgi:hypothetical protein